MLLLAACVPESDIDEVRFSAARLTDVHLNAAGIWGGNLFGDAQLHATREDDGEEVSLPLVLSGNAYGVVITASAVTIDEVALRFDEPVQGSDFWLQFVGSRVGGAVVAGGELNELGNGAGITWTAAGQSWGLEVFAGIEFVNLKPE